MASLFLAGFFVVHRRLWEADEALKRTLEERTRLVGDLQRPEALFSHGSCPDCERKLYPEA